MTNRSSSLIIIDDDASNDSRSTEEPPSPTPALVQLQQQVTSESHGTVCFTADIPVSPSSSSISNVSSQVRCSTSLDSATVTATDMSAESLSSLPSQSESLP